MVGCFNMQSSKRYRVLIIGKTWPEPGSTAAGRRVIDITRAFCEAGHHVTFASAAQPNEHSFDLKELEVSGHPVKSNDSAFDSWVATLAPDIVLFDRFMIEEQFGWRVEKACPNALRILDTSDLHCLREARRQQIENSGALNLYNEVALREIAAIHRSDLTFVIADYELQLLREKFNVPEQQIAYLPFWMKLDNADCAAFESRWNFIMIGSFMHAPNVDALRWCKRAIWPLIRKRLPQAELHCYGAYGDKYKAELHAPKDGFIYKGRAESALLTMKGYRVNCAPLRYGAGLKGKVFDGFQSGTPTVTTLIGAEGILGDDGWGCTVSNDPKEFAKTAGALYEDRELWQKVQAQGQSIVRQRFNSESWLRTLSELIENRLARVNENRACHFVGRMLRHHQHKSTEYMSRWIEAKNRNKDGACQSDGGHQFPINSKINFMG